MAIDYQKQPINTKEATAELVRMRDGREELKSKVKRKRSWRDSEKAATMAHYQRQIDALNFAIVTLTRFVRDNEGNSNG